MGRFRDALREGMEVRVRDGFRRDVQAGLENTRREDVAGAALVELAAPDQRPEVLPLVTIRNEINLYQARAVLAESLP